MIVFAILELTENPIYNLDIKKKQGDSMSKYYKSKSIKIESTGKKIELLIFQPTLNAKPKDKTPAILWIHGGGYITGMARMIYMSRAIDLVKKYGAVVVTPEYRLSNEAP